MWCSTNAKRITAFTFYKQTINFVMYVTSQVQDIILIASYKWTYFIGFNERRLSRICKIYQRLGASHTVVAGSWQVIDELNFIVVCIVRMSGSRYKANTMCTIALNVFVYLSGPWNVVPLPLDVQTNVNPLQNQRSFSTEFEKIV